MPRERRTIRVSCTTDHKGHRGFVEGEDWHHDSDTLYIPSSCKYYSHEKARVWTNRGDKNKHRLSVRRNPKTQEIISLKLEVFVHPRGAFWQKRNWRGVEVVVYVDCPGDSGNEGDYKEEVLEEVGGA